MPCYHPMQGLKVGVKPNGKADIKIFKTRFKNYSVLHQEVDVLLPCGQCVGCRLERSRQWAIRCVHEAQLHLDNCFITLTYSDSFLPKDGSLVKKHFQDFMKRFRKKFGNGIRYFHCGEYGEKLGRPHYHACIFGFDFPDRLFWKESNGIPLFTSNLLSSLWTYGFSSVGDVTFESAAYVARYIMKKVNGDLSVEHYRSIGLVSSDGEVFDKIPEYTTMSRRPGIGRKWFDKFCSDVYPSDEVVLRGVKMRPPRYYDTCFEIISPEEFANVKAARKEFGLLCVDNNTPQRLEVREKVQLSKLSSLVRNLE